MRIVDHTDIGSLADAKLRSLIQAHLVTARESGLIDLTVFAVAESGDTKQTMIAALGFSPLDNLLDGTSYGDPNYLPAWDWLEIHPRWFELLFTVGDDGFAYIIFISRSAVGTSALANACAEHVAGPGT
ncbi:hypothetical protein [Tsuneonella amylolytica]|uniref:hypothetical protein n=1 Tax=Tsuneonella amylolytica TaxID=2338327 RepID=UPI000EAA82F6|nr:hypothetical protein [Tsuneonella amylolytica]